MRIITVVNTTKSPVLVKINTEKNHVTSEKTNTESDITEEEFVKRAADGKIEVPGIGITVGGSLSTEDNTKLRKFYRENKEKLYEWNGFLQPGWIDVPAGEQNTFSIEKASKIYFIAFQLNDKLQGPAPRSEDTITQNLSF